MTRKLFVPCSEHNYLYKSLSKIDFPLNIPTMTAANALLVESEDRHLQSTTKYNV